MNLANSDFLIAFVGGVLVSFTPCIYPIIPVTAGYIGAGSGGSRIKGFLLSLSFVAGTAVTYSILGIIAALGGVIFGKFSTSPVAHIAAGALVFFFGLAMFGLFPLPLPAFSQFKGPERKTGGYIPAFLLGAGSGLVVSPCISPALGAILAYLATKRNVFYGAFLLFSFSCGMGVLLVIVGTFSSSIINWLPKSGKWMNHVKSVCAGLLVIMGLYFIYRGIRRI